MGQLTQSRNARRVLAEPSEPSCLSICQRTWHCGWRWVAGAGGTAESVRSLRRLCGHLSQCPAQGLVQKKMAELELVRGYDWYEGAASMGNNSAVAPATDNVLDAMMSERGPPGPLMSVHHA